MSAAPLLALAAALMIMIRADHLYRSNPLVEGPARAVGVVAIFVAGVALVLI